MTRTLSLFVAFTLVSRIAAIAQDTTWFKANPNDPVNKGHYRVKMRTDSGWLVTDHYLDGKTKMTGNCLDQLCLIRQGDFTWYDDSTGQVEHRCSFVAGKENGVETYTYANGQVNVTGTYKNGQKDGEWTGYYPSGKMAGRATYANDKQIAGTFYHEDGTPNTDIAEFYRAAQYPGGNRQFMQFIMKNMRYPKSAEKQEIQGTVVVSFLITPEGKAEDIKVLSGPQSPDLDAEAIRIIALVRSWTPGFFGGRVIKSYEKQPIVFRLE